MDSKSIVIIGPMGVGKTSVSTIIAERLHLAYVDVDELRWDFFFAQPDFDNNAVKALYQRGDTEAAFAYMKPFEARYAAHILQQYTSAVFDFSAGYTVYADDALFTSVQASLAPYKHVVFLRYSADPQESLAALQTRHAEAPEALYAALNKQFIESPCNGMLATLTVDTKHKIIDQVADEVIAAIRA